MITQNIFIATLARKRKLRLQAGVEREIIFDQVWIYGLLTLDIEKA